MDIEILGYLIFFKPYLDGIWVYDFEGLSCAQHFDTPIPCKWLHVEIVSLISGYTKRIVL